jgi:ATP-dependent DNA helicase RecG
MAENQNIEWKESWHNDYFKWICGFANAYGGVLVVGKDNEGRTKHIDKAEKLMEDLPNQVRDLLGIMVDVNLCSEEGENLH